MIFRFDHFGPLAGKLIHGVTLRNWDGDFGENFGGDPVTAEQVHGDTILVVESRPQTPPQGDALITRTPGLPIAVRVADCQGILIADSVTATIAAVHSGWRGSAKNILGKTIARLREMGCDPRNILIGISPSLGPCCAEFTDPRRELPEAVHPYIQKNNVDFWELSRSQCKEAGIPGANIALAGICTKCHAQTCFSHRNGNSDRMLAFIELISSDKR